MGPPCVHISNTKWCIVDIQEIKGSLSLWQFTIWFRGTHPTFNSVGDSSDETGYSRKESCDHVGDVSGSTLILGMRGKFSNKVPLWSVIWHHGPFQCSIRKSKDRFYMGNGSTKYLKAIRRSKIKMKQTEMLVLLWQVVLHPWHQTPQLTTPMYAIDIGMVILIHTHCWVLIWIPIFNSLRPSDAYMRRWSNHHWFR